MNIQPKWTPGPWKWLGEDYRGGWGWQLLVGPNGEGLLCGQAADGGPYAGLRSHCDIDPLLCKTGFGASQESAPAVHVREANAHLIAAAPELYEALAAIVRDGDDQELDSALINAGRAALARARGES